MSSYTSRRFTRTLLVGLVLTVAACGVREGSVPSSDSDARRHITAFRSFDKVGDSPGSDNQLAAMAYATDYFKSLGLETLVHVTPLVRMTPTASRVQIKSRVGPPIDVDSASDDFIMWPGAQSVDVSLDAGVVFAGFGIVSPEYNRDDYEFIDVTGKIVVVLEGWPHSPGRDDLGVLGSTYYGTPQYKFTEAAVQGAAGIMIVNRDIEMPWSDRLTELKQSPLDIAATAKGFNDAPEADLEGWLSHGSAVRLFSLAGLEYETEARLAAGLTFVGKELEDVRITMSLTSERDDFEAQDVLAILPGTSPDGEYAMLAGRWNRLVPRIWDETATPNNIANPVSREVTTKEALEERRDDDGSGAAIVMEAAKRLTSERVRPRRSIVFMVATALEPGIVGLEHFVEHPPDHLPAEKMIALVFLDHGHESGTSPVIGKIGTEADTALSQITRQAAIEQGRLLELDGRPKRHAYYSFAQTALVQDGVRTIYLTTPPKLDATARTMRYLARRDDVVGLPPPAPSEFVAGPVRDAKLLATVISRVANATNWPPRIEPVTIVR
jgi:hypothetical protein